MLLLLYVLCFQSHCLRIVSKLAMKILRRGKARQILVMCTPSKNSYFVKRKKGSCFLKLVITLSLITIVKKNKRNNINDKNDNYNNTYTYMAPTYIKVRSARKKKPNTFLGV